MLLKDFIDFNPKESLSKDFHKKISMDQLKPFQRYINSDNYEMFSGGSKFRNGDTIMARITPCLENGKTAYVNCLTSNEVAFGSTEFIVARAKKGISLPLFIYYLLCSTPIRNTAILSMTGSSGRERVQQFMLDNYEIPDYSLEFQQHIIDTIGSIDDLIENIEEKSQRVKKYGNKLFSKIRLNNLESLLNKVSFSKGKEIGSLNYLDKQIDDSVPYIRVGDLLGGSYDTFTTNKDIPLCSEEDILITFDGAPGRNNYGLKGAISSGIQKVVCKQKIKGFIYFYINSDLCQNTIQSNAQGTTILHASKAIKELKIPVIEDDNVYQKFNDLFSYLIVLSKEKTVLQKQKQLLLQKYFG